MATSIKFGNANASEFNVISPTTATAKAPPGNAGVVDVKVATAGGTSDSVTGSKFTYVEPTGAVWLVWLLLLFTGFGG